MLEELNKLLSNNREEKNKSHTQERDTRYSVSGMGGNSMGAITVGARMLGGARGSYSSSSGGTFDYLSNSENTTECFYQKLTDLSYYESHSLTEKITGIYRDYLSQLWKGTDNIIDIPNESPDVIKRINDELNALGIIEILMKDLGVAIFYGSVSYEITGIDEKDPKYNNKSDNKSEKEYITEADKLSPRNIDRLKNPPKDRKYSNSSKKELPQIETYFQRIKKESISAKDKNFNETESNSERSKIESVSNSSEIRNLLNKTNTGIKRGVRESKEIKNFDTHRLNPLRGKEGPDGGLDKIHTSSSFKPSFTLNKLRHPHHTIVEYDRKVGRRYLVKATEKYHIPTNKHQIFYFGHDNMRIIDPKELDNLKSSSNIKGSSNSIKNIISKHRPFDDKKRFESLGIDPKDPKKTPTRYELLEKEMSAGSPLFYYYLPKIKELYLKDLVISILGIKDVIQPDILAMNFEGGTDIDNAQELADNMESLLNKSSDYSMFNSSALNYQDLVKMLIDTVRVLPDIDGKLQNLSEVRTTKLQEKIQQIRQETNELQNEIIASLGVPLDLFEGNSSKWEVIKRSERLQSRISYYTEMIKSSIKRLAQSLFYRIYDRELKPNDFKVLTFVESDLDIAQKTNKLQNLSELSNVLLNTIVSAERELSDSALIDKSQYFNFLKKNIEDIYPEAKNLIDIDNYLNSNEGDNHED